jgi:hypothetical protein
MIHLLARSGEAAKSGPIALAIILILCVACYFLFKSMSKHLKNVREQFPADAPEREPGSEDESGPAPEPTHSELPGRGSPPSNSAPQE